MKPEEQEQVTGQGLQTDDLLCSPIVPKKRLHGKEVAIIGLSLRFPQAHSLEEFWQQLIAQTSLVTEMPSARMQAYPSSTASQTHTIKGGFIEDVACFDAAFFNISPREAEIMDPQQRIALELAWKAIEDAGYRASTLAASRTGVFMGVGTSDYAELLGKQARQSDPYMPTGTSSAIVANRISYFFDFRGPSMTVNTACASSITAIQQAVSFLNNDNGELALAGALNLCLSPDRFSAFDKGGALSKEGKCKVFDQEADGYVRGEGGAILVLKSLQKAIEDADTIYAVIKGVGTNHGGRTNSLTATNSNALASLIEEVYERAGVTPDSVTYIEAHAMGAPLGDPMEVYALKTAFHDMADKHEGHLAQASCGLGSVKANIGHLEAAAGMAGILKVLASIQHQTLPACIHFANLNSIIRLNESPFYIVDKTMPWEIPPGQGHAGIPRRAGVSAVGFGGVNAHLILEEYIGCRDTDDRKGSSLQPLSVPSDEGEPQEKRRLIPLSAKHADRLQAMAANLLAFLKASLSVQDASPTVDLQSLAYTLQVGREALEERVIFAVSCMDELVEKLHAYVDGQKKIHNCWQGNAKQSTAITSLLSDDEDSQALLRQWATRGKLEKLAELWVQGMRIDWAWDNGNTAPLRRLSLPTYPFTRKHYWLPDGEQGQAAVPTELTENRTPAQIRRSVEFVQKGEEGQEIPHGGQRQATVPTEQEDACKDERLEEAIQSIIVEYIAQSLKMKVEEIALEHAFADYGLTSLIGVHMLHFLNERLGIRLADVTLFDYRSVKALTQHIVSTYGAEITVLTQRDTPLPTASSAFCSWFLDAQEEQGLVGGAGGTGAEPHTTSTAPVRFPTIPMEKKEMPAVLPQVQSLQREPIAIIGMSGRFAKTNTVDELWEYLVQGEDLIEEFTRWAPADVYPDVRGEPEQHCLQGSFLKDIDQFDPLFFKISGLEATYMDPQQRLFLEECWKALEDAGYAGESVTGHSCSVYVGVQKGDYDRLFEDQPPSTAWWGNSASVVPARIAYYLDLKGPAIAVDTACSSSLVALHLACQGLWNRETELALAGGVFVQSTPWFYQTTDRAGMLSPGGCCFTFDGRANGFVPGEGVGVIVLKRLADALHDGDHIYGVVKGSGMNQDGTTNGIAAPNGHAQMHLEQEVYETFGIDVEQIQMVEAHGTGTALGDPIEINALKQAFDKYTRKKEYCSLGSIKTNIGHTAAAAGIAGVIKVLLALKNEKIPPAVHFQTLNPRIELQKSPFFVHTTPREWKPEANVKRSAAVSSFSFCGTNAHVVIEETSPIERELVTKPGYLIVLSARSVPQLREQATRLLAHLEHTPELHLGDVSYTLLVGRKHCEQRLACVAQTLTELIQCLRRWLEGQLTQETAWQSAQGTTTARVARGQAPRLHHGTSAQIFDSTHIDHDRTSSSDATILARQCLQRLLSEAEASSASYLDNLGTLAQLYVQGTLLDLKPLFAGGTAARVSLPTYPFARERYWVSPSSVTTPMPTPPSKATTETTAERVLHPLLHRNTSTLSTQRYTSTFSGREFFIRDHHIKDRPTLPAVAYLEMARAGLASSHDQQADEPVALSLQHMVWAQPLVVDTEPVQVTLTVMPHEQGHLTYEIRSLPTQSMQDTHLHSQGIALPGPLPPLPPLDLAALRSACYRHVQPQDCYTALRSVGITHGPALQGLEEVHVGQGQVLARLFIPASATDQNESFVLHPTLLDTAIQAAIGLKLSADGSLQAEGPLALPFALERLDLYGACLPHMWVWVRKAADSGSLEKLDIDLCDETGMIRVRLQGYSSRQMPSKPAQNAPPTHLVSTSALSIKRSQEPAVSLLLRPAWEVEPDALEAEPASPHAPVEQLLICGGTVAQQSALKRLFPKARILSVSTHASIDEMVAHIGVQDVFTHILWIAPAHDAVQLANVVSMIATQEQGVLNLFRLTKALLWLGYDSRPLQWSVVTTQSLPVHDQEICLPAHAPVHGLIGSLAKEYPRWQIRLLDLPDQEAWPLTELFTRPTNPAGRTWAYRQGQWYCQQLLPYQPAQEQPSVYRPGAVYVVIGGAGGLGTVWSEHVIRNYQAQVIWLGRREVNAEIEANIKRMALLGPAPRYLCADACDEASLAQARQTIWQDYGHIDGVVHSVLVLEDQSLANMQEERFRRVLAAKVDTSVRLAQVFATDPLDFVLFFSSTQSYTRAAGQSNYVAGTIFEDVLAHWLRQQWPCAVKVINWGYWGHVGVAASPFYQQRMAQAGLGSIEPGDGMAALDVLMGMGTDQLTYLKMTRGDALPGVKLETQASLFATLTPNDRGQQVVMVQSARKDQTWVTPQPVNDIKSATITYLKTVIGEGLLLDPKQLRADERLENYGIDSLVIVAVTNQLEEAFGPLSKTLFFEYVNIQQLADYFINNYREKLDALLAPKSREPDRGGDDRLDLLTPTISPENAQKPGTSDVWTGSAQGTIPTEEGLKGPLNDCVGNEASQHRQKEQSDAENHDIAVVGIAGRFPHAENLEELWQVLLNGEDCFEPVPPDRWNQKEQYYQERDILGKTVIKEGTFIKDIDKFDARYFNISQRDADLMSPETRQFLQVSVEALEDAGYSKEYLQQKYNGNVGVLVSSMNNDYRLYGFENMLTRGALVNGDEQGMIPNRLSYHYGFTGPSIFLDTMCSSASVCLHLAVQMLRSGECNMMVVGAMNLFVHPYNMISVSQAHFTSKSSGVVRSYGLGADGTILGEGVITVVLKRKAEAERDGDHIYTVIKGTGIANAGIRNGFSVPDPHAQSLSIERAIEDAGINPRSISYFEGHGSGTALGDPIEIRGATKAFQKYTQDVQFCPIGSVKSNTAHTNAAAGLSGLTKVILQLMHRKLVASLHSETLNPNIDFAATPFYVQRELTEWKRPTIVEDGRECTYPLRAGITSIGAVGMSAHIIVEEYEARENLLYTHMQNRSRYLMVFSAMNTKSLRANLERFKRYIQANPHSDLASVSYTLQVGKNELPCRLAIIVPDRDDLVNTISDLITTEHALDESKPKPHIHFVKNILAQEIVFMDHEIRRHLQGKNIEMIADLWTKGAKIDWDVLWGDVRPLRVSLPAYCFEKIRCWYTPYPDAPSVLSPLGARNKLHPFLGKNVSDLYTVKYSLDVYLDELLDYVYRVKRAKHIIPTFMIDTAFALADLAGLQGSITLKNVRWNGNLDWKTIARLHSAMTINGAESFKTHFIVEDHKGAQYALGQIDLQQTDRDKPESLHDIPGGIVEQGTVPTAQAVITKEKLYEVLASGGLRYDPFLEGIEAVYALKDHLYLAQVLEPALKQDHHKKNTRLSPVILGAIFQGSQYIAKVQGLAEWSHFSPTSMGEVHLSSSSPKIPYLLFDLNAHRGSGPEPHTTTVLQGNIYFLDANGRPVGSITDARFSDLRHSSLSLVEENTRHSTVRETLMTREYVREEKSQQETAIQQRLEQTLCQIVSEIVEFSIEEIDVNTHFNSFGFNSISIGKLASEISQELNIKLNPALLFQYENIKELSNHLFQQHLVQLGKVWQEEQQEQSVPQGSSETPAPLSHSTAASSMPIAIIGMAGKFPQSENIDEFATHLFAGDDLISPFPLDRYDQFYQEVIKSSSFPTRMGALNEVDTFDADFFNISPLEAEFMDPQHRLALETVWQAVEDSGYRASQLPENTGIFMGVTSMDYASLLSTYKIPLDAWSASGTSHAMLVNRISFMLNIHGPSEAIDTACSSSLVALHRAMESIRSGRCDLAIAGGVNILLSVDTFVSAHLAGMLSPDGTCKTFAKDANGYVRGEGVGALILKPLEKARQDGDHILGILIGSAENHGGRASSLTAPNAKAQAQLIMQAMQGIDPRAVSYIETHGTGTHLGDPVEIEGLKLAYHQLLRAETVEETSRAAHSPYAEPMDGVVEKPFCGLGSVKTNAGHLEAAAGIAGVVKVLLAMKHQQLPATLHCQEINPYIDLQKSPFYIVQQRQVWERQYDRKGNPLPRRAGVSSFGFGGANAHVVLEEYIEDEMSRPTVTVNREGGPYVVVLSARNKERLKAVAQNLALRLKYIQDPEGSMQKIAYTLQTGREEMAVRLALVVASSSELKVKLQAFIDGQENIAGLYQGQVKYNKGGLVLFTVDDKLEKSIAAWIGRKQYGPILSQWVKGMLFDWNRLYAGTSPGRISLPGYPFAKERFWLPQGEHHSVPEEARDPKQTQVSDEAFFSQLIESVLNDSRSVEGAAKDMASFLETQTGHTEPTIR